MPPNTCRWSWHWLSSGFSPQRTVPPAPAVMVLVKGCESNNCALAVETAAALAYCLSLSCAGLDHISRAVASTVH